MDRKWLSWANITLFLLHVPFPRAFSQVPRSTSSKASLKVGNLNFGAYFEEVIASTSPSGCGCACFSNSALGYVTTRWQI